MTTVGAQCQRGTGHQRLEQRTDWGYDHNAQLAQTAENNGFDYALSQVRYEASYGAEYQHESTSFSLSLLLGGRPRFPRRLHPQAQAAHRPRYRGRGAGHTARNRRQGEPARSGGFKAAVQQAGNSTADKRGMWADSSFEDLVQYNDGFRTQLIGTPEQIAERIAAYRKRGVDLILGGFLHFQEEIEYFGSRVLPLVREIENAEEKWADAPVLVPA
jgi:alkanesulfonate monooxygenase SsuD/methylene tetrahydromethanopterin reductase-like flavin-dependent oxidoreductase (luciferase family)